MRIMDERGTQLQCLDIWLEYEKRIFQFIVLQAPANQITVL